MIPEEHPDSQTWFMEYDIITLTSGPLTEEALLETVQEFSGERIITHLPKLPLNPKHYMLNIGHGLREIVKTLYNFFIVEEKLSNNETIKRFFSSLVSICKTEISYAELFFVKSETFIFYRLMSCLLRGVKFYTFLYYKV